MTKEQLKLAEEWMAAHEEEYLEDLRKLVEIRSVADEEAPDSPFGEGCLKALKTMLSIGEKYGYTPVNYGDRVGSLERKGKGDKVIGVWGHLDVVPEGDDWVHEPYKLTREGDVLFGRGVSDNKGPAVAGLYALRILDMLGIELDATVRLYLGTDEEKGMADVMWFRENYPCPDMSLIPDSSFPVCYAEKGILEGKLIAPYALSDKFLAIGGGLVNNMVPDKAFVELKEDGVTLEKIKDIGDRFTVERRPGVIRITANGVAMHSANPYHGVNAIRLLSDMLLKTGVAEGKDAEILDFINRVNDDCDGTTLGIVCEDEISGHLTAVGSVLGLVDGKPALTFNIRYPATLKGEPLVEKIRNTAEANNFTLALKRDSKPAYVPKDTPVVKALTDLYNELTGSQAKPYTMAGGTYARKLPNAMAYGPSGMPEPEGLPEKGGAHQHDEGKYLPHLMKAAVIYAAALEKASALI